MDKGFFARPTIFADVESDMTIARDEIFGPVLSIISFADEEEAVRIANDTPYGLAAFIQSGDRERVRRVSRKLRAGSVLANGASADYDVPFGGYKQSGNGRENGVHGLQEFLEVKAITF
jgi:aldehyde dehydrogenase (NAD+)